MADFSKRHYEAIAKVLRDKRPPEQATAYIAWREMCHAVAAMFERDNPRFNVAKFWEACEPLQ